MKLDFFYDEDGGKPYESIGDWYQEIKHLMVPLVIILALIIFALAYNNIW